MPDVIAVVDIEDQRGSVVGELVVHEHVDVFGDACSGRERCHKMQVTAVLALVETVDVHRGNVEIDFVISEVALDFGRTVDPEAQKAVSELKTHERGIRIVGIGRHVVVGGNVRRIRGLALAELERLRRARFEKDFVACADALVPVS